jgi:hypothetical protein
MSLIIGTLVPHLNLIASAKTLFLNKFAHKYWQLGLQDIFWGAQFNPQCLNVEALAAWTRREHLPHVCKMDGNKSVIQQDLEYLGLNISCYYPCILTQSLNFSGTQLPYL